MGIEDSAIHGHCAWPPAPAAPAETLQRLVAKLRELSREALDKDIDELYHHLWPPPDIEEWRALLQAFASKAARVSREVPVTRVEVIGDRGRVWGRWHLDEVTLSYQDGGRTLKIFVRGDTKPPQKQVRG